MHTTPHATPQVFDGPRAALDAIEAAVVTGGNSAKGQVTSTIASFSGATGQLQTLVVDNIARVETDYKPLAQKVDGYRYQASMVLFALPIAVVLLLLFCALLVNFHFGVNLSVLLLLVLLVLVRSWAATCCLRLKDWNCRCVAARTCAPPTVQRLHLYHHSHPLALSSSHTVTPRASCWAPSSQSCSRCWATSAPRSSPLSWRRCPPT